MRHLRTTIVSIGVVLVVCAMLPVSANAFTDWDESHNAPFQGSGWYVLYLVGGGDGTTDTVAGPFANEADCGSAISAHTSPKDYSYTCFYMRPIAKRSGAWKTVTLDHDSKLTMDLPAEAAMHEADYLPTDEQAKSGLLMGFTLYGLNSSANGDNARMQGEVTCNLVRFPYDGQKVTRTVAIAQINSEEGRNGQCETPDPSARNATIEQSTAETISGDPAGKCVANLSDSEIKGKPYAVAASDLVAGSAGAYDLLCVVHDISADRAQHDWDKQWANRFSHMEQSLHLPN